LAGSLTGIQKFPALSSVGTIGRFAASRLAQHPASDPEPQVEAPQENQRVTKETEHGLSCTTAGTELPNSKKNNAKNQIATLTLSGAD
jgi:hypothetical protein